MRRFGVIRAGVGIVLGVIAACATVGVAAAAPPPPLGEDGSYRVVATWSTNQDAPAPFLVASNIVATSDGEVYGIANYSSGSSRAVIRDTATGTRLASWVALDSPTGLALDADENPRVLTRSANGEPWEVITYSPTGEELSTVILSGTEDEFLVGLAVGPDGTLYTLDESGASRILSFTAAGEAGPAVALPGVAVAGAGFNLALGADGRLYFAGYSPTTGAPVLVETNPDGTDLTATPSPGIAQVAIGGDGRLLTLQNNGAITITALDGTATETIPVSVYAPWTPSASIGVASAPDGTVFVSGYTSNATTGQSVSGVTALQPLRSPDVVGAQYTGLTCDAFAESLQTIGTPPPTFFTVTSGSLPPGVQLNSDTGELSGVPTEEGNYAFSIQAQNGVTPTSETTTDDVGDYTLEVSLKSFLSGAPIIEGTPSVGSDLTARIEGWAPTPEGLAFQWLRDGENIDGATNSTYAVTAADVGHELRVAVTGSADCYAAAAETSTALPVIVPATPTPTPVPTTAPAPPSNFGPGGDLPRTGFESSALVPIASAALAAVVVGAVLLLSCAWDRRRAG